MLIVRPEAETDMIDAYNWYEGKNKNLGEKFIAEVDSVFNKIISNPEIYMLAFQNTRRCLCQRFPYAIYFSIQKENIIVHAVLHQRQNPLMWQNRI